MTSSTQIAIRQAALDNGWTIKATVGETYKNFRGTAHWDRDIFQIGQVQRQLKDGTPVTEAEHVIEVFYTYGGAVSMVYAHQFTVAEVLDHQRIGNCRGERNKAERVISALAARTSVLPRGVAA